MAYVYVLPVVMLILVSLPLLAGAIEHIVGGDQGWSMSVNYTAWAQDQQFFAGDTLVFNYQKGDHSVVEVDRNGFLKCAMPANARVLKCAMPPTPSPEDSAEPEALPPLTSVGSREGGAGSLVVIGVMMAVAAIVNI